MNLNYLNFKKDNNLVIFSKTFNLTWKQQEQKNKEVLLIHIAIPHLTNSDSTNMDKKYELSFTIIEIQWRHSIKLHLPQLACTQTLNILILKGLITIENQNNSGFLSLDKLHTKN